MINYFKKLKNFKLQNQKTLNTKKQSNSSLLLLNQIEFFFPSSFFFLFSPSSVPLSSFLFEKSNCCPDFELVSACPEFRVCEMGVSKASSVVVSNGRNSPKCWCNEFMKAWVSNTVENPKRKFWRCRNYWEVSDFHLFSYNCQNIPFNVNSLNWFF